MLDHLVVVARTLDEGAAWVESRLGAALAEGGKHELMATHNRLLSLGPAAYLEVMAIDPEAPPPARPRCPRWQPRQQVVRRSRWSRT